MRHPSEYSTVPFGATRVMVVDAGTVIKDDRSGQEVTITDQTACSKGNVIFCTEATFEALKAHSDGERP